MAKKFLTSIDLSGNQLIRPVLENVSDNPETELAKGRLAFNTTGNVPIVYNGSSWKNLQYEIPAGTYLTENQTITLSGVIGGSGKTSITTTIKDAALSIAKTSGLQDALNAKMTTASYPSLTAIQALANTSGFLKKTGASTWSIDTNSYLTQNQTITLSGIITGSGRTAITTSIADDALTIAKTKGLQTALDAKMATASYPSLTAIQALANTSGFLKKTGASTWTIDTNSYLTSSSSLSAAKLTGTIPSAVLANSTLYVGTTPIKLNRASGNLALTGITSIELGGSTNVYLKYDSVNNAVYVEKKVGTTITPVNFYATGEVAGFGAGSGLPDGGSGGGGVSALGLLNDVSLTTATSGNVLMFNGTHWVNKPQSEIVPDLSSYASKTYVDTKVSSLVDSAPEALDTLVELAAALGNDENFATTVANEIGTKEPEIKAGTTAQYWRGNKTWATLNTTAVPEGTNKYYTDARVKSYGDTLYLGKTATASQATKLASSKNFSIGGSTGLTAASVSFNGEKNVALSLTGTLKVANGGTGLTDAKNGFTRKVIGTLATSATSYKINHGLGTDVVVQVIEVASKAVVECDIIMTSTTEVTIQFNKAPAAGAYRYIIVG